MIVQMLGVPGLEKMSPEFRSELWRLAQRLGLNADYIACVMQHESGLNPAATNPNGGATGLIQFMPATAQALGTSTQALRDMGAEAQLKYVERFFAPYARKIRPDVPGDYLMATFMPKFIGDPPDTVLFARGTIGYTQNAGFDHAGKGTITIADVTSDIDKIVAAARPRPSIEVDTTLPLGPGGSGSVSPPPQPPLPYFSGPSALPVLELGSRGLAVALWQRYLNHPASFGTGASTSGPLATDRRCVVTGIFDSMTVDATRSYQSARGLVPDAHVGPITWGTVLS